MLHSWDLTNEFAQVFGVENGREISPTGPAAGVEGIPHEGD